jgi:hypothetical protein
MFIKSFQLYEISCQCIITYLCRPTRRVLLLAVRSLIHMGMLNKRLDVNDVPVHGKEKVNW